MLYSSVGSDLTGLGSVSSGTLVTEHLVSAFADCLETHAPKFYRKVRRNYRRFWRIWDDDPGAACGLDVAAWVLESLETALENIAPKGFYFGATEGDACDFGFWPIQYGGCYNG